VTSEDMVVVWTENFWGSTENDSYQTQPDLS